MIRSATFMLCIFAKRISWINFSRLSTAHFKPYVWNLTWYIVSVNLSQSGQLARKFSKTPKQEYLFYRVLSFSIANRNILQKKSSWLSRRREKIPNFQISISRKLMKNVLLSSRNVRILKTRTSYKKTCCGYSHFFMFFRHLYWN